MALRPLEDRLDQEPIASYTVDRIRVVVVGGEEVVCGAVLPVRLSERVPVERLPSRSAEVVDGLHHVAAALVVVRQRLDELSRAVAELRLDATCDPFVEELAIVAQQAVVRDLLREHVLEDVLEIGVVVALANEVRSGQSREADLEVVWCTGDGLHDPVEELAADHRRLAEHPAGLRREVVDAGGEEPADRRRDCSSSRRVVSTHVSPSRARTPSSTRVFTSSSTKNGLPSARTVTSDKSSSGGSAPSSSDISCSRDWRAESSLRCNTRSFGAPSSNPGRKLQIMTTGSEMVPTRSRTSVAVDGSTQ